MIEGNKIMYSMGDIFGYLTAYFCRIRAALDLARVKRDFLTEKRIMKQEKCIRAANYTSESISTRLRADGI